MSDASGDRKVQLGCGTLILIALIVMFFSGGPVADDVEDLESEVQALQEEIVLLRQAVEAHTESHTEGGSANDAPVP